MNYAYIKYGTRGEERLSSPTHPRSKKRGPGPGPGPGGATRGAGAQGHRGTGEKE